MALAPSQQAQLEQLHAITNGDLESEQAILESVGWDVQVCFTLPLFFLRILQNFTAGN